MTVLDGECHAPAPSGLTLAASTDSMISKITGAGEPVCLASLGDDCRRRAQGRAEMRRLFAATAFAVLLPFAGHAQTAQELAKGYDDTKNVLNYGMGYNLQRFSPLTQINKETVKKLVPVWSYSFDDNRSEESQPLVYQGVLYVTTNSATMAVDVKTGKQL